MIICISTQLWKPWNTNGCFPLNTTGWQTQLATHAVRCMVYLWLVFYYYNVPGSICMLQSVELKWWSDNSATFSGSSWQLLCHMQAGPWIIKMWLHCSNHRAQLHIEMTLEVFCRFIILVIRKLHSGHFPKQQIEKLQKWDEWNKKIQRNHDNCQLTVTHPHYLPVNRDQYLGVQDIQVLKQCFPKETNWNRAEHHAVN